MATEKVSSDLTIIYKSECLESHIYHLDFIIGYTRRKVKWMAHMAHVNHKYLKNRAWCNRMCVDIHIQRNKIQGFEEKRKCIMASMAIQEICLNKANYDLEVYDDVLQMILHFAIT